MKDYLLSWSELWHRLITKVNGYQGTYNLGHFSEVRPQGRRWRLIATKLLYIMHHKSRYTSPYDRKSQNDGGILWSLQNFKILDIYFL